MRLIATGSGQFYTPRDVVKFMLDRAGFSGADGVLRIEGDSREPIKTLDFASGSGGFVVEIARRVIDDSGARRWRRSPDGCAVGDRQRRSRD